jgi:MerR family transcriptional regulator, light-induced transcriptional regulator
MLSPVETQKQAAMPKATQAHLPIRTISTLTGVNAITLRAWERRYGLICPLRSAKGHRLYTQGHVEEIRRVLAYMGRGIPISQVPALLKSEAAQPALAQGLGPWAAFQERIAAAITRLDEPELDQIYDEALSVHSIENVMRELILPLLARLGERWDKLPGSIAEEHFFATHLRSMLGARLQHRMRYATGPRVLAACVPGEYHEIGLLLFGLEAQAAGLRVVLLGADMPLEELSMAARRSGSEAIVLSSSADMASDVLKKDLPELVRRAGVPVFVGGASALRQSKAIGSAGAIVLGVELQAGVRILTSRLNSRKEKS